MSELLADHPSMSGDLDLTRMRGLVDASRRLAGARNEGELVREVANAASALASGRAAHLLLATEDLVESAVSGPSRGGGESTAALHVDRAPAGMRPRRDRGTLIVLDGAPWARLWVDGPDLTAAEDEAMRILVELATAAARAIVGCAAVERRRAESRHLAQVLEVTTTITRAIGDETDLDRVLELIVDHGRRLIDARMTVISLPIGDELEIAAAAGAVGRATRGARIPIEGSTSGAVLRSGTARRIPAEELGHAPAKMGLHDVRSSMLVPLVFRGRALGVLAALDRQTGGPEFSSEDEDLLAAFATSAAIAVATAQHVGESRLRDALEGAERERRRWARELHDDTLQGLAGLRLRLEMLERRTTDREGASRVRTLVDSVAEETCRLRTLITALRPAALDELGLQPALESLVEHVARDTRTTVELSLALPTRRLRGEDETTVYRIIQEALTNVAKHADASACRVSVSSDSTRLWVSVVDDGLGIEEGDLGGREGFGVTGMRERAALAGGELCVENAEGGGTAVRAILRYSPSA